MLSDLPGSVAWCLTLILENGQSLFQILLFSSFSFSFWYPHDAHVTPLIVVQCPWTFWGFVFDFYFHSGPLFSLQYIFEHRESFLSCVQPATESFVGFFTSFSIQMSSFVFLS